MQLSTFADLPEKMAAHHAWEQLLAAASVAMEQLGADGAPRDWSLDLHTGRTGGREAALDAMRQWYYEPDQQPREARRFIGMFAVGASDVGAIETLNQAKSIFADAIGRVREDDTQALLPELTRALGAARKLRQSLTSMGQPRVHLLQATRHIPILPANTHSVGFTWARGSRSTEIIELEEAIEAIEKRCSDNPVRRSSDIDALMRAVANGYELRKARITSAHLRANISFGQRQKKQITASLPFAVVADSQGAWPRHAEPGTIPIAPPMTPGRLRRLDVRLSEEPLTVSAPFYAAIPAGGRAQADRHCQA